MAQKDHVDHVSLLQMPEHAFLMIQAAAGDPSSVCALETLARSVPRPTELAWSAVLEELFPSLFLRLVGEDRNHTPMPRAQFESISHIGTQWPRPRLHVANCCHDYDQHRLM